MNQYGNPVAPPTDGAAAPAANVRYVDQFGNPVAAPTTQPAVKYVDQYGNPVAAPVSTTIAAAPIVKYVDQYGNPVAAPVGGVIAARAPIDYKARNTRQQRIAATVFGGLGFFFIMIGWFTDNLARDHDYDNGNDSGNEYDNCSGNVNRTELAMQ